MIVRVVHERENECVGVSGMEERGMVIKSHSIIYDN